MTWVDFSAVASASISRCPFGSYPGLQTYTGQLQSSHTPSSTISCNHKKKKKQPLPNLCFLLQCLKRSCLKLSTLPLSHEGAFSQQLHKLLYCKLWFNLQLRSPAHLQCKLTCQTAFCEARRRLSSALPTVLRGQEHLAEAEQPVVEVVKRSHSKVHEISFTNGISHNLQFISLQCTRIA